MIILFSENLGEKEMKDGKNNKNNRRGIKYKRVSSR